jgi:serine protease Do
MKNRKRFGAMILALTLMLSMLALFGCQKETPIGVAGMEINAAGELILKTTDGETQNLGVVVGQNGADGQNGTNGARGEKGDKGDPGQDGAPGKDGNLVISSDSSAVALAVAKGLRSSVSIVAGFTGTFQSYPFMPTYEKEYTQGGSGIIYELNEAEGNAFIVTNYHVVYSANSNNTDKISDDISVYLYGSELANKAISATYVGGSQNYDIAVLRIEGSELLKTSCAKAVTLGSSADVAVGTTAIAIGNAEGEGISASYGIISVDSEYVAMKGVDGVSSVSMRLMRIDTAVNHGNSGGGLFNDKGELFGIVNAKLIDEEVENIGYAIPMAVVKGAVDNIIAHCYGTECRTVLRAVSGIVVTASDSHAVYDVSTGQMRIEETVTVVEPGANVLGTVLQAEDVLISFARNDEDPMPITRQHHVIDMMLAVRADDDITVTVLRGGEEIELTVTVQAADMQPY